VWLFHRNWTAANNDMSAADPTKVRKLLKTADEYGWTPLACLVPTLTYKANSNAEYESPLALCAVRIVWRYPKALTKMDIDNQTPLALYKDACGNFPEDSSLAVKLLSLMPDEVSSFPSFTKFLHQFAPFVYEEIFGSYNTVVSFLLRSFAPHNKVKLLLPAEGSNWAKILRSVLRENNEEKETEPDRLLSGMKTLHSLVNDYFLGGIAEIVLSFLLPVCE